MYVCMYVCAVKIALRHIWGTDLYTSDSDCAAILMHSGVVLVHAQPPTEYAVKFLKFYIPTKSTYSFFYSFSSLFHLISIYI